MRTLVQNQSSSQPNLGNQHPPSSPARERDAPSPDFGANNVTGNSSPSTAEDKKKKRSSVQLPFGKLRGRSPTTDRSSNDKEDKQHKEKEEKAKKKDDKHSSLVHTNSGNLLSSQSTAAEHHTSSEDKSAVKRMLTRFFGGGRPSKEDLIKKKILQALNENEVYVPHYTA
jgi:hypothetical protein